MPRKDLGPWFWMRLRTSAEGAADPEGQHAEGGAVRDRQQCRRFSASHDAFLIAELGSGREWPSSPAISRVMPARAASTRSRLNQANVCNRLVTYRRTLWVWSSAFRPRAGTLACRRPAPSVTASGAPVGARERSELPARGRDADASRRGRRGPRG